MSNSNHSKKNKMKRIKILLVLSLFLTCYANAQTPTTDKAFTIHGELSGLKKEIKIELAYQNNGKRTIDTTTTKKGRFELKGNVPDQVKATITAKAIDDDGSYSIEKMMKQDRATFYLTDGTTTIKGTSLKDAKIVGTPVQNEFNEYTLSIKDQNNKIERLYKRLSEQAKLSGSEDEVQKKTKAEIYQIKKEITALTIAHISKYPDSYVSLSLLSDLIKNADLDDSIISKLVSSMSNNIKTTKAWQEINNKLEADKKTGTGTLCIDFTKKDINGNNFTLNSLKGKYVLLDFWGSWCHPCRNSHPHLKEVYEKYKSKGLEIIGIAQENGSTDITKCEETWKKAVKEDGMTWIQVMNNYDKATTNLVTLYAIQGFPTKILLDKDGKVVFRILGNQPEKLDEKLKAVMGE